MNFIRPNLAVSGYHGIGTRDQFLRHGFHAHLQCADGFDRWLRDSVVVAAMVFPDGTPIPADLFAKSQAWLAGHWDQGDRILISCAAGISRSVSMAAALLALKGGANFLDAIDEVMAKRPEANPHPSVLASASMLCGQPLTLMELRRVYASQPLPRRLSWPEPMYRTAIEQIRR